MMTMPVPPLPPAKGTPPFTPPPPPPPPVLALAAPPAPVLLPFPAPAPPAGDIATLSTASTAAAVSDG